MPCVSKCCCCFSLKYGNLTYGVICLIFRICTITLLLAVLSAMTGNHNGFQIEKDSTKVFSIVAAGFIGWLLCTSIALFIALKGIIQRRSILLYPYIVVLIFEILCLMISTIIEIVTVTPWALLKLIIVGTLDIYAAICLVSLYQHMKQNEKRGPVMIPTVSYKNVI